MREKKGNRRFVLGKWLLWATSAALLVGLLGACKIGPNFKAPPGPEAPVWREIEEPKFVGEPVDQTEWWKVFNDPVLDSLIEEAFAQNLTLQAAALRVVEARVHRAAASQLLAPLIAGSGSAAHLNFSENVKPDVDVDITGVLLAPPGAAPSPPQAVLALIPEVKTRPKLDMYSAGFDAVWELDVWGKARRRIESANAGIDAAFANYDDVMVSLAAEVAASYVQIRTLQKRREILVEMYKSMKQFSDIAVARVEKGESPETDKWLSQTLLYIVQNGIPSLERMIRTTENSLCVLLGKTPQALQEVLGEGEIPTAPASVAIGVPNDLLRRRPDVRLAERLAHAQCARIGVAKAAILPSFSLIGSLGLAATNSEDFFEGDSSKGAYGGAVSVTQMILYPFTIERVRLEDARFEEVMRQYEETVLRASAEAENAMFSFLKSQEEQVIATSATLAATRSSELALGFYEKGIVIVSVPLVALTIQAGQADRAIEREGQVALDLIAMYKALGGGWQIHADQQLVPQEILDRMKDRSDWWTFFGKHDLDTARNVVMTEP